MAGPRPLNRSKAHRQSIDLQSDAALLPDTVSAALSDATVARARCYWEHQTVKLVEEFEKHDAQAANGPLPPNRLGTIVGVGPAQRSALSIVVAALLARHAPASHSLRLRCFSFPLSPAPTGRERARASDREMSNVRDEQLHCSYRTDVLKDLCLSQVICHEMQISGPACTMC